MQKEHCHSEYQYNPVLKSNEGFFLQWTNTLVCHTGLLLIECNIVSQFLSCHQESEIEMYSSLVLIDSIAIFPEVSVNILWCGTLYHGPGYC